MTLASLKRRASCKLSRMLPTPPPPSLEWCLFLDVDGTLIELTDSPLDTHADPGLKALLGEVAERLGGAVALVSGRSIGYLDALFAPLRLPAAGLHGVERRKASGLMQGASFVDSQLDRARTALAALVMAHPGTVLEDKGRTIAVHFRMAPQSESAVRDAVRRQRGAARQQLSHPGRQHDAGDQAARLQQSLGHQGVHEGTAVFRQKARVRRR